MVICYECKRRRLNRERVRREKFVCGSALLTKEPMSMGVSEHFTRYKNYCRDLGDPTMVTRTTKGRSWRVVLVVLIGGRNTRQLGFYW